MAEEIERKFLVQGTAWKQEAEGKKYSQGYIYADNCVVRARIAGDKAYLTVKGETVNISRKEFEYEIPVPDAEELLCNFCSKPLIEKTRYEIEYMGKVWVVDEFYGDNAGLVLAEIELEYEDEAFESPPWIGTEVSGKPEYYNSNLVRNPYSRW